MKGRFITPYPVRKSTHYSGQKQGIIIDPFAGSGSTGVAALQEGFHFLACEREPEYVAIAEARIKHARSEMGLFEGVRE